MATLTPLAMSSTKDDLLKHLQLPPGTYALMAKETDRVYIWLTSGRDHLKANCKRVPPYDWSDIQEKSKDEAMKAIANGGDEYTDYYWRLGGPTTDSDNWIAKWFLYHKFRYRDGRNRSGKSSDDKKHHHESRQSRHHGSRRQSSGHTTQNTYYQEGSMNDGTDAAYYDPAAASSSMAYLNSEPSEQVENRNADAGEENQPTGNMIYDPVRDL